MRECSAGACPPQGSGWGMAESAMPIRCTKPQLRLFIPWCAGARRHERLVRKHVPDSDPGCALQSTSMPALHRRNVPNCRPMVDAGMRKCSARACPPQGSGWGVAESTVPIRCTKSQLQVFILWCAGGSRHERLVRKHVPDSDPGWMSPLTSANSRCQFSSSYAAYAAFARPWRFPRSKACPVPRCGAGIQGRGGRRTRATLSRNGQFRHNLRSLFDHNLQTRRTNYAQI